MGNPFSIPCDPCVNKISQWLDEKVGYTHNLEKNLDDLKTTMDELKAKRDDLSRRVTREEGRGLQRLAEFQVWLDKVETIENKVTELLNARNAELQRLCLCGFCSKSLLSSYRYGKSVFLTLSDVKKLYNKVFKEIAEQAQTPEVEEIQLQPIIVGQETMLDKAWKHLREDKVGTLGMYGMGGVGKTTLLSQLNNKFSNDRCGFDFVIWVVVSKELHVEKILDEIAQKVGLGGEEWRQKDRSQRVNRLFNFLRKKRFMLFLDDIWEKVDLAEIGVPFPTTQNKCKVAFTTRSQAISTSMGAKPILEVQCLADKEAFDLFQKKVGQLTLESDTGIPDLARIVSEKCSGLPLALNVIGETMSCKRTTEEWRHAIDVLNSYAAEFSGMEDKILPLLKYSYDSLKGDKAKSCLLYCALFPEDAKIDKETLIDYWICEGIIDGSEGIEKAEREGYDIIGSLVCQSLLIEGVDRNGKGVVSMHDVVREMALWIASDFIVRAGVGLSKIPKVENWKVVRRMSLLHNRIEHLDGSPECPLLTTLLLQRANLSKISSEFFMSMPKLAVLDLSYNGKLSELPEEISNLVSLQFLNLSGTGIQELSKGLKELKKLIHLELEVTRQLKSIAGISSLQNLKVLKLSNSGFRWDLKTVEELEALEHLEVLTTSKIHDLDTVKEKFLSSQRLMSCIQNHLEIERSNLKSFIISLPPTMDKLRNFSINNFCTSEIKMGRKCSFLSLSEVRISYCYGMRELTFLMFAPNLRFLEVIRVDDLEDIINKEKACEVENSEMILPFPKLTKLHLPWLPKLKNIYWSPLPFPCLKKIYVKRCRNLTKLPLDSKSGNGLIITFREGDWLDRVEWEDEATETRILSSCQMIWPPSSPTSDSDDYIR